MRARAILSVLSLTLVVSACAGPKTDEFTLEDREAIQKTDADLVAAFNAKDLDRIAALYDDNAEMMPPNAPSSRGRESVRTFYANMLEQGANNLRMERVDLNGHGPLAFESGSYSIEFTGKGQPSRDRGKYVQVLRNTAGHWRIEKTIWSSDLPKPPAAAN